MLVSAIVAMDKNKVIGVNNDIPWYLPADFRYFKRKTMEHHIVMGRKCFDSMKKHLRWLMKMGKKNASLLVEQKYIN